ncbi:MAG: hypothetical protein ACYTFX_11100 [Planctomycetota bacterium]|jgi:hypothetical protein
MNTANGWIKLYRCLLEDVVCQKSTYFHLWVTLLMMAAHKQREFIFNNQIHKLLPGQLITGRKKLSKLTGIRQSTVEDILRALENAGKIRQQKNTKFRVITITKWDDFQSEENARQQTDSTPTTGRQHADTYKNDKNEKNEKNIYMRDDFYLSSEQREIQRANESFEKAKAEFLRRAGLEEKNRFRSHEEREIQRVRQANEKAIQRWLAEP